MLRMKDVLIVNLTRMGDLIQTTPVIRGLRHKFPDVRITLLVNSSFSEICQLINGVDRLISFDIGGLIDILRKGPGHLVDGFRCLEGILSQVNETCYDLAINYTHSTDSAILFSLIRASEIRGHCIDEEGHSVKRHPWIRYFFNIIPGRYYNPFHLCDIYLKIAGLEPDGRGASLHVSDDIEGYALTRLNKLGVDNSTPLIAFQLGASAEDKRWPVRSFALLGERLVDILGAKIVLTGSKDEEPLGKEFERVARITPLNLIGKTDLKELAALLKRCNLLISNDTGTLHIATAVGTRTINISLASVYFRETGPYGEGHYVITPEIPCSPCSFHIDCRAPVCKEVVDPNHVLNLALDIVKNGVFLGADVTSPWENVQVYESFFDDDGLLNYRPTIKRPLSKETVFNHLYRKTWLSILDGREIQDVRAAFKGMVRRFREWYEYDPLTIRDLLVDEFHGLIKLKSLIDMALAKIRHIAAEAGRSSPDIEWIKMYWDKVPVIEDEIEAVGRIYPALKPLTIIFRYGKECLEDKDLPSIAEGSVRLYEELKTHVSLMIQLMELMLERRGKWKKQLSRKMQSLSWL